MYLLILILCSLLLTTANAILNGEDASIEDFPYQVAIQDPFEDLVCGGSILSESWILTTYTCVSRGKPADYKVRAGTDLRAKGGSLHQVDKVISHAGFRYNFSSHLYINDIALVRVKEQIKFDETRRPIEMFGTGDRLAPGEMANVSGFGWCDNIHYPKQLQWTNVPVMDTKLCNQAFKSRGGVPEGYFCADWFGLGNKSVCFGDDGGPMVVNGRLAGYPTWIYTCEFVKGYLPVLYTDVAYYRQWIDRHLNLGE